MYAKDWKNDDSKTSYVRIFNPIRGEVIVIDRKNRRICREPMEKRAKRIHKFTGIVYGFADSFLQEIRTISSSSSSDSE